MRKRTGLQEQFVNNYVKFGRQLRGLMAKRGRLHADSPVSTYKNIVMSAIFNLAVI